MVYCTGELPRRARASCPSDVIEEIRQVYQKCEGEAGSGVRPYTDTLLEIVGFTTTDAKCYIRKHFEQAKHLAEALIRKVNSDEDLRELTKNPLNTLLLCVIFEDFKGVLPTNRTQLYVEIIRFILSRYESRNVLSNRGEDLLLVYKKELMLLGETALDSLRKQELYFDDHKGDIKQSLFMKFGFLSIQSGGSKRTPCDRYGFFHKSFQEFFSGYLLAFSVIDGVKNSDSVLTDERHTNELFSVFKFMIGITAQKSEETALSIVQSIVSIVNKASGSPRKLLSKLNVAITLINECKSCSGDLYTKLVRTLGANLKLVDLGLGQSFLLKNSEFRETFLRALSFNSTVSSLHLSRCQLDLKALNMLAQTVREHTSLSSLDLSHNSIDDEGANLLAQALGVNSSLSSLDLSDSFIGDEEANSLAQALRVNSSLSSLNLSACLIGCQGVILLAQALGANPSLSSLKLSHSYLDNVGIKFDHALRGNTSLSSFNLHYNCRIGARGEISLVLIQ
ncbi:PREDICTED: protein NLRC3-like [Acropora digitifera]|uniref:protein NLRC3-like n=1 Tax=Acropora digitifera TaxID=70779 RepID=UPI00077A6322|nr:PREDICTED: protein NLRC3-like [Acropora digitifera]